jgi:hypothetical protein
VVGTSKSTIFWDITPCSLLSVNRRFGGTYRLHLQGRRIGRARNQRASRSVDTQWTTRRYIPEDNTLHNHRCENLKSYTDRYFLCLLQLDNVTDFVTTIQVENFSYKILDSLIISNFYSSPCFPPNAEDKSQDAISEH